MNDPLVLHHYLFLKGFGHLCWLILITAALILWLLNLRMVHYHLHLVRCFNSHVVVIKLAGLVLHHPLILSTLYRLVLLLVVNCFILCIDHELEHFLEVLDLLGRFLVLSFQVLHLQRLTVILNISVLPPTDVIRVHILSLVLFLFCICTTLILVLLCNVLNDLCLSFLLLLAICCFGVII